MELIYSSTVRSIYELVHRACNLSDKGMEEKTVQIDYQGQIYDMVIRIEYEGIDSHITAQIGETHILFASNGSGGVHILTQGPPLEEGLINEVMRTIIIELDN